MSSRDNVLFEAGLFLGRLGRERTRIYVQDTGQPKKEVKMPSDLLGIQLTRFSGPQAKSVSKATVEFQRILGEYSKRDCFDGFRDRRDLGSLVLQGIKQSYYLTLDSSLKRRPPVRVNIMVPIPNSHRPRIKILFVDDIQPFRKHELRKEWGPDEGKAGRAWNMKTQQIYAHDSTARRYRMQRMRGPKRKELTRLKSVMSTPIFSQSGDQVCGVLNLDSQCEASVTDFTKLHVYSHLRYLASQLSPLLRA